MLKIGDKISFKLCSYELTASWDTPYGIIHMYTFKDIMQRIFIWKTNKLIDKDITEIKSARIKSFEYYNGQKEILLTYCKLS